MPRTDILEHHESMRNPFLLSILFHASVCALALFYGWVAMQHGPDWGDPNASGGAIGITPVSKIPLPAAMGRTNPVANDTESQIPQAPPEKKIKAAEPEPEDAIPLKAKRLPKSRAQVAANLQKYRPTHESRSNQLYSTTGQALASPMFGGQAGAGGVGVGSGNPFGNRCGGYLSVLRQKVANSWRYGDIDPRLRTAPMVVVRFQLLQDGSIRDVTVLQRSGNYALDTSAQRAIMESAPFESIPAECGRQSANLEFWFQLQR
ncbi:MAG: TonB family protein [Bryobacterales bacterium]|nr:TonB family protein [Bryobacterales bacterium]